MIFDREKLFDGLRIALGVRFSQVQVNCIEALVGEFERRKLPDMRWLSYMMSTGWGEAKFQPIEEIGKGKGKPYGKPHPKTKQRYYGRGFIVQLTWYENYLEMETTLGVPLTAKPELALDPAIQVQIAFEGMTTGKRADDSFTKYQLHDFFNATVNDPVNARRIINGKDRAEAFARWHYRILEVLEIARLPDVVAVPAPAPKPVQDLPQLDVPDTAESRMSSGLSVLLMLVGIAAAIGLGLLAWAAQFIGE